MCFSFYFKLVFHFINFKKTKTDAGGGRGGGGGVYAPKKQKQNEGSKWKTQNIWLTWRWSRMVFGLHVISITTIKNSRKVSHTTMFSVHLYKWLTYMYTVHCNVYNAIKYSSFGLSKFVYKVRFLSSVDLNETIF